MKILSYIGVGKSTNVSLTDICEWENVNKYSIEAWNENWKLSFGEN